MIESPRHKKGDLIKIAGKDYRICIAADELTAVYCHCNNRGESVRFYDVLCISPIYGRYNKPFKKVKNMDNTTLSMRINKV